MRIKEVMSPKPEILASEATIREAAMEMRDLASGALPVYKGDQLIGMVTDRDLTVRGIAEGLSPNEKIKQILSNDVFYCFEDDDVKTALKNMHEKHVQRFIVLDNPENKELVGIVSVADIADQCKDAESVRAIAACCSHYQ